MSKFFLAAFGIVLVSLSGCSKSTGQSFLATAAHSSQGAEGGGGGDICQDRIENIRNDISQWIADGGSQGLDFSKTNTNLKAYDAEMQNVISLTRTDDQTSISCADNPAIVQVDGAQKTCVSYPDPAHPKILCYRGQTQNGQFTTGFMGLSQDDQYFQVHHELAVLAGIEDQSSQDSDYSLSDQLVGRSGYPGYLVNEIVRKLAIQPQDQGPSVTITQVGGPTGTVSGSTFSFPAENLPSIPFNGKLAPGEVPIDFSKYQYIGRNYPIFNVSWNPNDFPPSSTAYMLVVTMMGTINGTPGAAGEVIATTPSYCPGVNGSCVTSTPMNIWSDGTYNVSNSYYAEYSIAPGATVQLALDFRAMCDSFLALGNGATGGTGCSYLIDAAETPPGSSDTQIFLNFGIYAVPSPIPASEPVWNPSMVPVGSSGVLTFDFSNTFKDGLR